MFQTIKSILIFFCVLAFISLPLFSQSQDYGVVNGSIATPDGQALPGAEVTISSPKLIGGSQSAITNANGEFRFIALPPGTYTAEARLQGFTPQKIEDIRLTIGTTLTLTFT